MQASAKKVASRYLFAREYWGSQGAGILYTTPTRALLMHRSPWVYEPGTWGVVGGKVEEGENPRKAALREAKEELGRLPKARFVDNYVYRDGDFRYTTFIARVDEETPESWTPTLNWENDDWAWVTKDEVHKYRLHFGVVPVLRKLDW